MHNTCVSKQSDLKNDPTVGIEHMTWSLGGHHIHYVTATYMYAYYNTCVSKQRVRSKERSHSGIEPMTSWSIGGHHIHYAKATFMYAYYNPCISEQRVRSK